MDSHAFLKNYNLIKYLNQLGIFSYFQKITFLILIASQNLDKLIKQEILRQYKKEYIQQQDSILNQVVKPKVVFVQGPSVINQNFLARKINDGKQQIYEQKDQKKLNLKHANKQEEEKQEDSQVEIHNAPISLILGQVGVGKTSIMKKLFDNREINEFQPEYLPQLNSYFADTLAFDFESSVEEREEQIKLYQQLFNYFPDKVSNIFILVNFERTDLMKDKIIAILTKFRKFIDRISIIITDFQLSENPQNDEKQLRNNLKYFNTRGIIFTGRNTSKDELIEKLRNVMLKNDEHFYPFDLKGTHFEIMNPEEINSMMEDLKNRLIKN